MHNVLLLCNNALCSKMFLGMIIKAHEALSIVYLNSTLNSLNTAFLHRYFYVKSYFSPLCLPLHFCQTFLKLSLCRKYINTGRYYLFSSKISFQNLIFAEMAFLITDFYKIFSKRISKILNFLEESSPVLSS